MVNDSPMIIIGVGNPYRGDDAVGLFVAVQLRGRVPANIEVHENFGEVATMIELLEDADVAFIVDAVSSGSKPGRIFRFDAAQEEIPADSFRCSTHAFGIPEAIGLARVLGKLPAKVIVYGIEGKDFKTGEGLSPEVEDSAKIVIDRILQEIHDINKWGRG